MMLKNNSIFTFLILLSGCGGGGSSSESPLTQSIVAPINNSSWNLEEAFEYGMADGTYTQQITIIENGELLKTEYRDIGNIEANQLIQSGRGELVSQYQGVRSNSPLTSWSTAKSFTGILIGIAQDQNLLNIDDCLYRRASDLLPSLVIDAFESGLERLARGRYNSCTNG